MLTLASIKYVFLPPQNRSSVFLIRRPVSQKIILNYYFIFNFVNKKIYGNCFLSCYICTYIISSVLPFGLERLKYLRPDPLEKNFADQWSRTTHLPTTRHFNKAILENSTQSHC